ncbi:MAG: carboxynorspermidine decarboxylase [Candidatus Theseobacter exili]|nr:carboxynorspermidine decarboxylase [Candidatus Theseobacter exili]
MINKNQLKNISSPCYVCDEEALLANLDVLADVRNRTGCKILLALKGFAMFSLFPLIRNYLDGVTASSIDEARLGSEEFGSEVHICAPAYKESEFYDLIGYSDHIVFNSFSQWKQFKSRALEHSDKVQYGIRINPEHSEVKVSVYDPCQPYSRLGVTIENFTGEDLEGISGLHFHTLCELNADALKRTLESVEESFGDVLFRMDWVNFGGGHHITRKDYNIDVLCDLIVKFRKKYNVEVILEPGEAVALNTGVLVASVLDIVHNQIDIAVLDASAAAHMPDVLEMPYRPEIVDGGKPGEFQCLYRLGGSSCLAGDIIGDYSFRAPLKIGSKVIFLDMAHYTMVKNNTFNGLRLPSIAILKSDGSIKVVKNFTYEDYKNRLS